MDRETVLQNVMNNYSQYGVVKEDIESLIDDSVKEGESYDFIYFFLQLTLADICGLKFFWCTPHQMASAFGISDNEMIKTIGKTNSQLNVKENGMNDYFKVPVEIGKKFLDAKE